MLVVIEIEKMQKLFCGFINSLTGNCLFGFRLVPKNIHGGDQEEDSAQHLNECGREEGILK